MFPLACRSLLVVCSSSFGMADAPLPDLETVRSMYIDSVTSIHTLDCHYRVERQYSESEKRKLADDRYVAFDVRLVRHGTRQAVSTEFINPRGDRVTRSWYGFDGGVYARLTESLGDPATWHGLPYGEVRAEVDNNLFSVESIDCCRGEYLHSGTTSLSILFQQDGARVVGWENVDKHRCLKVISPEYGLYPRKPDLVRMEMISWLDPMASYLPRRIRMQTIKGKDNGRASTKSYGVTDFIHVRGETDGKSYVFPRKGSYESPLERSHIEVVSVVVNGTVSDHEFKPQFPELTLVNEHLPNQKPRSYVVGDAKKREEEQRKRDLRSAAKLKGEKKETVPPKVMSPPSARPAEAGSDSWSWIMRGVGLVLCLLAVGLMIQWSRAS